MSVSLDQSVGALAMQFTSSASVTQLAELAELLKPAQPASAAPQLHAQIVGMTSQSGSECLAEATDQHSRS